MTTAIEEVVEFKTATGTMRLDKMKGEVVAVVAVVGNKDSVNDIITSGAFDESLKTRKPRVVWGHDWNTPIGKVLDIYEVPAGDRRLPKALRDTGYGALIAKVQFNLQSEKGREAFASVQFFGEEQEWSIGYKTRLRSHDAVRNANLLQQVELFEVSPVLHGANQLTSTLSIKDGEEGGEPEGREFKTATLETADEQPEEAKGMLDMSLRRSLGRPVRVIHADPKTVVYSDGGAVWAAGYRFDGARFLFDAPRRVQLVIRPIPQPTPTMTVPPVTPSPLVKGDAKTCSGGCPGNCAGECGPDCACGGACGLKSLIGEIEEKAGRVVSQANMGKLRQALDLIQQVIIAGDPTMESKETEEKASPLVSGFVVTVEGYEDREALARFGHLDGNDIYLPPVDDIKAHLAPFAELMAPLMGAESGVTVSTKQLDFYGGNPRPFAEVAAEE